MSEKKPQVEYKQHKGLHKPEFLGNKPLDLLFKEISELFIDGDGFDAVQSILKKSHKLEELPPKESRYQVVQYLLSLLVQLHTLSNLERHQNASVKKHNLITISMHDMKTFNMLVNFIVIQGIYSCLPPGVGIPLPKRFLKSSQKIKVVKLGLPNGEKLLNMVIGEMLKILEADGDVKDFLMTGTGYSDVLCAIMCLLSYPATSSNLTYQTLFDRVEQLCPTFELIKFYSSLVSSQQPHFKLFVLTRLSNIPLFRNDGVMCLIEYICGLRDEEDIDIEKIEQVTSILLSKPTNISSTEYFKVLGSQLYEILILIDRPVLTSVAGHILEHIYLKNSLIIKDFVFQKIWDNLDPKSTDNEELISEKDLNNTINVIISIAQKAEPMFLIALFSPILIPLWNYLCFLQQKGKSTKVMMGVLVSFFTIVNSVELLNEIAQNLITNMENWEFKLGPNDLPMIIRTPKSLDSTKTSRLFDTLDASLKLYMSLLKDLDKGLVNKVFLDVLQRWLNGNHTLIADENPFKILINLRLLEAIASKFKDQLAEEPEELLVITKSFLKNVGPATTSYANIIKPEEDVDSDDEDEDEKTDKETLKMVLELLSSVISETSVANFSEGSIKELKEIQTILPNLKLAATQALLERINLIINGEPPKPKSQKEQDKQLFERAISSLNDPLVPIRAHGLYMLRQLIERKSEVISVDFVVQLHLIQLKDEDPFVYLNVIKGLEALIELNKEQVAPLLVSLYVDDSQNLDERLRIGEVLLKHITTANETIGELGKLIVSNVLSVIKRTDENTKDIRLRMSAMSILGMCCKVAPYCIIDYITDALDCVLGVLQLETSKEQNVMRRAAVFLVCDLITGPAGLSGVPKGYGSKVLISLRYIRDTDNDLLTREHAEKVLEIISESIRESMVIKGGDMEQVRTIKGI
ncbi:Nuclear import and biogenesis of RNA pol II involved protein [Komagataella phaffii CBS 7435]|uniref:RNA polymerase II assembly factor Rtp1 C-terminal domain-containing protein n=2 Tax=Komagataella phaffii TaxID=460519 RepID=C4QXJ3_KOMPG|nr:uncharacterized protein PAS_chr1-4_0138 [Komagataella phaffii GS115]AOA60437.1 GQ67_02049T0 [Komagataella phaffii]CAH2446780.1 Nuclear import and biogenesis of RNA pol II involved protein [Komagataella phaffii CBS 7435]AOA66156.1 GQ68_02064T0 [Komagataella phaffii GS115]CAY67966.1 Putative protein of unknown function [Komagataella phaffii GS115]CCA37040.1 Nuclear import and biogenesis of RNA pol II involved protein [Komagataella phaffii CBS 7435]